MKAPKLKKEDVTSLYNNKFLKLYQMDWDNGSHYLVASRRNEENLIVNKSKEELKSAIADAVTCVVVLHLCGSEYKLYLEHEFRYPTGQFLLSPPAGLIDAGDKEGWDPKDPKSVHPALKAAKREIKEETGITVKDTDELKLITAFSFSTPGMTDESNALALAVVELNDCCCLTDDGCECTECFDGYSLLSIKEAKEIYERGTDENGIPFSIYTWCALTYFLMNFSEK